VKSVRIANRTRKRGAYLGALGVQKNEFFRGGVMKEAKDVVRIVGVILLGLFLLIVGIPLVLVAAGFTLSLLGFVIKLAIVLIKLAVVVAIGYLILVGVRAMLK
jgi:hypothetical protein